MSLLFPTHPSTPQNSPQHPTYQAYNMCVLRIDLQSIRNLGFYGNYIPNYHNSLFMNPIQTNPPCGPYPYDQFNPSLYYYQQQNLPCQMNPLEMNMYYLIQQNIHLQQQLIKQKQIVRQAELDDRRKREEFVKVEDKEESESQSESSDFKYQVPRHTHHTEATLKQLENRKKKIKKIKGEKNETKNIPKNYGKAIVTFIESNKELVRRVVSKFPSMTFASFMAILRSKKRRINSIADLRSFWLQAQEEDFPKITRILSNIFLRYYSLEYIFNSRISNYAGHVKYRGRLVEALRNPNSFTSIKQY